MENTAFDTLATARKLKAAGIDSAQAEAIAEAQAEAARAARECGPHFGSGSAPRRLEQGDRRVGMDGKRRQGKRTGKQGQGKPAGHRGVPSRSD